MTPTDFVSALATAVFLSIVANRLVEGLIVPLFDRFKWDKFVIMYISWLVGGIIVWVSGVNLFTAYIPNPTIGQFLTALVAGGGANLIADIFDQAPKSKPDAAQKPTA